MDPIIVAAIIGAFGAVLAAIVPFIVHWRSRPPQKAGPQTMSSSVRSDIEMALRSDPQVQRLLANPNWCHTAEAAIKSLVYNITPPVENWPLTATWQQVAAVYTLMAEEHTNPQGGRPERRSASHPLAPQ